MLPLVAMVGENHYAVRSSAGASGEPGVVRERQMEVKGLIRSAVRAMPTYIPGKPIEEVERELGVRGAIKMASNENPLGPSEEVRRTIVDAAGKVALYPDANAFYFKETLASAIGMDPSTILVGNGLDDVLRIIAQTFFAAGDEIVMPTPTFSVYRAVSLLAEALPMAVAGPRGPGNDLAAMRSAVTERTKAVFICNPNNPTGTIVSRKELEVFLEGLPAEVLVILDEAYADFADASEMARGFDFLKAGAPGLIVLRTFSKIHGMAGLRLGYSVAQPEITAALHRMKDPFNVNSIALAAGIAALGASAHAEASRNLVFEGRRRFYAELTELGIPFLETQANFILIDLKRDSQPMYDYLLHRGLIVRPTHSFGLPTCIRVTFGSPSQNDRFFELFREALAAGV